MALSVSEGSTLSPRRRRSRPQWNKEQQRQQQQHHVPYDRPQLSPPTSPLLSYLFTQPSTSTIPNGGAGPILSPSTTTLQSPNNYHKALSDPTSTPTPSSQLNRGKESQGLALIVAVSVLCFVLIASTSNNSHKAGFQQIANTQNSQLVLRRRLLPSSFSSSLHQDDYDYDYESRNLRYLSFGGPLTFGRGLEISRRTSEAYPYLMASLTSETKTSSTNHDHLVHNVAHPRYESMGPTMASLCTQSIVEGSEKNSILSGKAHSFLPSIEYDVITLEYSLSLSPSPADGAAFLSSIRLLVQRLKQRYPLAKIVLVRIWTPSDLVYHDTTTSVSKDNHTVVFYSDWRRHQQSKREKQFSPFLPSRSDKFPGEDSVANSAWIFRELSQIELEVEKKLEFSMDSEGVLIYNMPRPDDTNDHTVESILKDWFLEEEEEASNSNDSSKMTLFRYTLSQKGHSIVAKGIHDIIVSSKNTSTSSTNPKAPWILSPPATTTTSRQQKQPLFSWGSGDSCRFWYDTTDLLPQPETNYGDGLEHSEIAPGLHALEVVSKRGTAAAPTATLNLNNPFDMERMVYLTYLTASPTAASNKVYPKTRVRMKAAVYDVHSKNNESSSMDRSTSLLSKTNSLLLSGSSVILDPTHHEQQQHPGRNSQHRTRTSAVGVLPAFHKGILEFSSLEEYTIHPFRIVGVSILPEQEKREKDIVSSPNNRDKTEEDHSNDRGSDGVSFEFAMVSPRNLSVVRGAGLSSDEDEGIDEITNA